jgi:hypothetical protein
MWDDLSFSASSFDPDSWGPSWGLTWEAAQEPPRGGGGKVVPKRRAWVLPAKFVQVPSRRRDEESLLLIGAL